MNTPLSSTQCSVDHASLRIVASPSRRYTAASAAGFILRVLITAAAFALASVGHAATIQGGSTLLSNEDAVKLEAMLDDGPLTLTNIFSSTLGDGKTASDFHQAANGQGRTIAVIELPSQSGYIRKLIGGYNPQSWDSSNDYHYTATDGERGAFLFNLTTGTVFKQKSTSLDGGSGGLYQTFNNSSLGPTFGRGYDLYVDIGLHRGSTYGDSYGPSGYGASIAGGGQGVNQTLIYGTVEVFTISTAASAPKADTVQANSVTDSSATLNALVTARQSPTEVFFQYSTDPTLATGVITTAPPRTLDGSAVGTLVSKSIGGLAVETPYYYRVVATNALGTTTGAVLSFVPTDEAVGYRFAAIPNSNPISGYTLGSQFSVGAACLLSHLGVYDHNQDGLAADMPVGLWDAAGTLLSSTMVLRMDRLNGTCRYHALSTPVLLQPNTRYSVGAYFPVSDFYGIEPPSFSTDSRVSFLGYGYQPGGLAFPTIVGPGLGYFGANFLIKPEVKPPFASAGPDQSAVEGVFVSLDGSPSYDTNTPPRALTFTWLQVSGPHVTLANANTATPSFTTPDVPKAGAVLVFELAVKNGPLTSTDSVSVNVTDRNSPPTADAGADQAVAEDSIVTLDASLSSDPNSDPLTMQWSQISGPAVQLDDSGLNRPRFTAPSVTAALGSVDLKFQLVVNDGLVNSGPATVVIRVTNTNDAPIANAGPNQSVDELAPVTLDGSNSSDPDFDPLSYSWTQVVGPPAVALQGASSAKPTFQAPALNLGGLSDGTTLTFQLTVSDGKASNQSMVNVRVGNVNHAPFADAGLDRIVMENSQVTLEGQNSADTDADPLAFRWVQTGGPAVVLTDADTATPYFTSPDVNTVGVALTFSLTVDDGFGGTSIDDVVITVGYANRPPSVSAGIPQAVLEGDSIMLVGAASDPDGNPLTYSWTQVSGPAVSLRDAETLTPSFTAPSVTRAEDSVVLRLAVDDGYGSRVTSDVFLVVANVNRPPSAQAPANTTVAEQTFVRLIGQGTDPDTEEQGELIYAWQQLSGPAVNLGGTGSVVEFTAPVVGAAGDPNAKETIVLRLTVIDPNGATAADEVHVVVTNADHAPIAVAGGNLTVNEHATVTLNGSASSDPDGNALTYRWTQTAGPSVVLLDATTAYPYFNAPLVNAAGATLKFKLTVDDGCENTCSDTATVAVVNINEPPAVAGAKASLGTLWPPDHAMVKVSVVGVSDPNNNATIKITGVTQDEPTNGQGDGDTPIDAVITSDGTSVLLRAERSGKGDGRVYRVHFTASDFEGSATGVVDVVVPKSKKTDRVIKSSVTFDSTR